METLQWACELKHELRFAIQSVQGLQRRASSGVGPVDGFVRTLLSRQLAVNLQMAVQRPLTHLLATILP